MSNIPDFILLSRTFRGGITFLSAERCGEGDFSMFGAPVPKYGFAEQEQARAFAEKLSEEFPAFMAEKQRLRLLIAHWFPCFTFRREGGRRCQTGLLATRSGSPRSSPTGSVRALQELRTPPPGSCLKHDSVLAGELRRTHRPGIPRAGAPFDKKGLKPSKRTLP